LHTQRIGGQARFDQHIGLRCKTVRFGQRPFAIHQRQLFVRSIIVELGNVQRAFVQQAHVSGALSGSPQRIIHLRSKAIRQRDFVPVHGRGRDCLEAELVLVSLCGTCFGTHRCTNYERREPIAVPCNIVGRLTRRSTIA